MLSSIKRRRGFTLLEMLVVILLVSLLASLMMQGFIYMAGIYSTVERRQTQLQTQELLEGWLRDSVQGLINGIDGDLSGAAEFIGEESFFSGISLTPLGYSAAGAPYPVEWRLEQNDSVLRLLYGETAPGTETQWYILREWPNAQASWSYFYNGEWYRSFPERRRSAINPNEPALPDAIALSVVGLRQPFDMIIAVNGANAVYRAPTIEGMF